MMKIILLALLLAGCATTSAPKIIEVEIPVSVKCIEQKPQRPELITDEQLLKLDEGEFVTALSLDRFIRDKYIVNLETVIQGCKTPNN